MKNSSIKKKIINAPISIGELVDKITILEIKKNKFPIKEIPITFLDREKGESKIPKFEIIRTLISLFKYVLKGI